MRDLGDGQLAGYLGTWVRVADATSRGTPRTTTCRLLLEYSDFDIPRVESTKMSHLILTMSQEIVGCVP